MPSRSAEPVVGQAPSLIKVFVLQEIATSEGEAKKMLKDAKNRPGRCVGGRVFPPQRTRQKRWLVQTYYADDGNKPPQGMARLSIPGDNETKKEYGIEPTYH